jgi:hypothetical protein
MYNEQDFIQAIVESFQKYKEFGPRSPEKLKPLHKYFADALQAIFGATYELHFNSGKTQFKSVTYTTEKRQEMKIKQVPIGELTVEGQYYPKDIDMAVTYQDKPVFCLGLKFITSNFSQNANNYFESMMGETANIQRKSVPYAQIVIFRKHIPYYKKDGSVKRWESVTDKDLNKYLKLMYDTHFPHQPKAIGLMFVDIDEVTGLVEKMDLVASFGKNLTELLENKLSVRNLFAEIEDYKNYLKIS